MEVALQVLKSRARRAYEWSRFRGALLGAVPIVVLATVSAIAAPTLFPSALIGATLVAAGIAALWAGRGFQQALLPGILAGSLPLAAALCATRLGHAWLGSACVPVCLAASALGGVSAAILIGNWALTEHARPSMLAAASGLGLLTGSIGSMCVGGIGVIALLAGYALAMLAQRLVLGGQP